MVKTEDIKDKSIVFMGTPDFAVESLEQLIQAGIHVKGVITAPDKPAGRGYKIQMSAVKECALKHDLTILQPTNLKDEEFQSNLKALNADLFVVVAFRMLPESVWGMPPMRTINLHGSLLPQYRGAAPINWAVINGEEKTGATTFYIQQQIDTGDIIDKVEVKIGENDTAGVVHDKLMVEGAKLLVRTVCNILSGDVQRIPQATKIGERTLKEAPKLNRKVCQIDWSMDAKSVHNFIRGLSPYPGAWSTLYIEGKEKSLSFKVFESRFIANSSLASGQIKLENNTIYMGAENGAVEVRRIQLEGKKRMSTEELLRGVSIDVSRLAGS